MLLYTIYIYIHTDFLNTYTSWICLYRPTRFVVNLNRCSNAASIVQAFGAIYFILLLTLASRVQAMIYYDRSWGKSWLYFFFLFFFYFFFYFFFHSQFYSALFTSLAPQIGERVIFSPRIHRSKKKLPEENLLLAFHARFHYLLVLKLRKLTTPGQYQVSTRQWTLIYSAKVCKACKGWTKCLTKRKDLGNYVNDLRERCIYDAENNVIFQDYEISEKIFSLSKINYYLIKLIMT